MIACVLVDGDREYEVFTGTPAWQASMEWARFHGLDPNRIPAGSYVERDELGRCIRFEEFVKTGPEIGDIAFTEDGLDVLTGDRIEQGEAPPLPFPKEVTG